MGDRIPVGIVGLGMVGEPVRRWFAEVRGHVRGEDLFCYDTNPALGWFDDVAKATVIFVCVPTPPNPDGSCNTDIVRTVVDRIPDGRVVVIKSTVPPGTTQALQDRRPGLKLMFCPEFLTEAQAWADFIKPSRQLIGVTAQSQPHAVEVLQLLPQGIFQRPDTPIYGGRLVVSATEAELAKYASNVFGALKVAYANVLADMAWALGRAGSGTVHYAHVRGMVAADQRIGPAWLDVSHGNYCGFGGYCFPKDTAAFIAHCQELTDRLAADKPTAETGRMLPVLRAGITLLRAAYEYNNELLAAQNLTVADVSRHDKQVVLDKRRPIREP